MAAITIIRTYWQQKEHLIGAAFMLLFTVGIIIVLAAFRRKHGITPSAFRKRQSPFPVFSR